MYEAVPAIIGTTSSQIPQKKTHSSLSCLTLIYLQSYLIHPVSRIIEMPSSKTGKCPQNLWHKKTSRNEDDDLLILYCSVVDL
jgi:hypothetical protein